LGHRLVEPFLQVEGQPTKPQLEPLNNNESFVKSRTSPRMSPKFNAGSHRAEPEKLPPQADPIREEKVSTLLKIHY